MNGLPQSSSERLYLVVGRRGTGKSSLVNLAVGGNRWNEAVRISHLAHSVDTTLTPVLCPALTALLPGNPSVRLQDTTGFDDTVSGASIASEVKTILGSAAQVNGVVFVLRFGRMDDWDKAVFMLFLQVLLNPLPATMIGVVFTHSPDHYVAGTSTFANYLGEHAAGDQRLFMEAISTRAAGKIAFINNPCPAHDSLANYTALRQRSAENLSALVSQLQGTYSFQEVIPTLILNIKHLLELVKANPWKIAGTLIGVVTTVIGALGSARR